MKIGDVVKLKSGSEKMTIEKLVECIEAAACVWFEHGQVQRDIFPLSTLTPELQEKESVIRSPDDEQPRLPHPRIRRKHDSFM